MTTEKDKDMTAISVTVGRPVADPTESRAGTADAAPRAVVHPVVAEPAAPGLAERLRPMASGLARSLVAMAAGMGLLLAIWWAVSSRIDIFPGPLVTWDAAVELLADPFYDNGPNDMGIGWNVLYSLGRVGVGFGLAAVVGIPLGFIVGRFKFMNMATEPVIGLLRPVSPLAWLPIGLLVFQEANLAAIWVIFICSIWPMIMNTAAGVRSVPQDYLNVARVLNLSEWKVVTRILFPAVLPNILTGVRLAIGTAWLVIVAAEMLTGGVGIGFWVWDEWNNLKVEHIIIAIFIIGIVGLILEQALMMVARRFSYESH